MGSEDSILSKFIVHYAYILHMEMACMHEEKKNHASLQMAREPFWVTSNH